LIGDYPSTCAGAVSNNYYFTSTSYIPGKVEVLTACTVFNGFLSPVAATWRQAPAAASPISSIVQADSTIPVKFTATCSGAPLITGVHTLQAIKYSSATTGDTPIDATPTDAATAGNEFRLTGTEWHFNLNTKGFGANGQGIWLFKATLYDGSVRSVWVEIKK
jgi:hypothetical protein